MRLRGYLLILLLSSSVLGTSLILWNERWHARLDVQEAMRQRGSMAVLQLDHVRSSFERFLVTYDLVVYSEITYLAGDAQRQLQGISRALRELREAGELVVVAAQDRVLTRTFSDVDKQLGLIAEGSPPSLSVPQFARLDRDLESSASMLDGFAAKARESSAGAAALLSDERRAQEVSLLASVVAYLLFVILLVLLASRRIGRPIAILSRLADHQVGSTEPLKLADSGPTEFRQISNSVHRLIQSLGETVERRTRSLAEQVVENENTHRSLEASNAELRRTVEELRLAERALFERAKLAVLGEMVGGISHDFNNALVPILSYAEILKTDPSLSSEERESYLDLVIQSAEDVATVIRRLQTFSRGTGPDPFLGPVDIDSLVEDAVAMTEPRWKKPALQAGDPAFEVTARLGEVGAILGNLGEIRQALVNLIFNAIDAMPEGGSLSVETSGSPKSIIIQVRDSGIGMPPEVLARCREAFYSTKREKGTGLGLAMVQNVALAHGGHLGIQSQLGSGTTVRLELARRSPENDAEPLHSTRTTQRGQRVVLVDDDANVLEVMRRVLAQIGFEVETFGDPNQAADRIRTPDYALLVTDLQMPSLSGLDLAAAAREVHPGCKVVLLTGFAEGIDDDQLPLGVDRVLQKPVPRAKLESVLVDLLNEQ